MPFLHTCDTFLLCQNPMQPAAGTQVLSQHNHLAPFNQGHSIAVFSAATPNPILIVCTTFALSKG
jgi:hypothetical protein